MNKKEKINKIYEVIADKTLSFGCKIIIHPNIKKETYYLWKELDEDSCMWKDYIHAYEYRKESPYNESPITFSEDKKWYEIKKIIGHPVMIWDVLDWIFIKWTPSGWWRTKKRNELLDVWTLKADVLESQNELCIDFIFKLIQNAEVKP